MQIPPSILCSKWRLAVLFCLLAYWPATAQTVKNIRTSFDQSKQLMFIYYDLKGLNYKKEIEITPYYLSGDASLPPIKSLSGDTGWVTRGGKNKLIIWDPFKDGVTSLKDIQITLKTTPRRAEIPSYWAVALQGSNSAPVGLKVMQLSQVGFYGGFRIGKLPPSYRYTVNDEGEMKYLESGVYEFGSERRLAGYAMTAGLVYQLSRNVYIYGGGGAAVEQLFWKYQAYNLDKTLISSDWALNETINRKGITAESGVVLRFGRVTLDLGVSTIQLKSYQIIGGLGFSFVNKQKPWIRNRLIF